MTYCGYARGMEMGACEIRRGPQAWEAQLLEARSWGRSRRAKAGEVQSNVQPLPSAFAMFSLRAAAPALSRGYATAAAKKITVRRALC